MAQDALNTFLEERSDRMQRSLDVAKAVLGDKDAMTVTFKQEPVPAVRAESPRRSHTFHQALEFGAYLARYGKSTTVVLADAETGNARAALDEAHSGGFEIVSFSPLPHPLWRPWLEVLDGDMDLREFARFIGTQRRTILKPDAITIQSLYAQIRYSRVIHVAFGDSPGTANVIETMTEVKGNSAKSPVDLPDQLTVECPLFYGEGNQQISVDLKVDTSTECPRVRISSRDADAKRLEAIRAMMAKVQGLLPPEATVAIGVLDYQPWLYAAPVLGAYPGAAPLISSIGR